MKSDVGFYGDSDSKALTMVEELYGNSKVTKFECIGLNQKRVGCCLRKLKKSVSGLKALSASMIAIALRSSCTSVKAMSHAIMASFCYLASTPTRYLYDHCEKGSDSW